MRFGKGDRELEGLFAAAGGREGAVIAHPHSMMGGDMWNPVVETVAVTLLRAGISTLRFNFRGVGGSAGSFDGGRGEREDLLAACDFLEEKGVEEILPAGYSFGAWVAAGMLGRRALAPAIFVAPPIRMFPFELEGLQSRVGLIVCGDRDPYCPAEEIRGAAAALGCPLAIVPGADHFFLMRERELAACIESNIRPGDLRHGAS
ncbi:MAG: alpha/beta hydrolase [Thermodesulfobacteriota bacterium]